MQWLSKSWYNSFLAKKRRKGEYKFISLKKKLAKKKNMVDCVALKMGEMTFQ